MVVPKMHTNNLEKNITIAFDFYNLSSAPNCE